MPGLNNHLRIVHWNCNGLDSTKKSDISSFISENSIDILSLNENHESRPNLQSYKKLYHQKSKDLILYIHKEISFTLVLKLNSPEFDLIALYIETTAFIFCYLRHGNRAVGISKLYEIIMEIRHNFSKIVIIGDLNARLSFLGHSNRNAAGVSLENYLSEDETFAVLNEPHVYTFRRISPRSPSNFIESILDLCLVSRSALGFISSFQVLSNCFGSDHFPLFLEVNISKLIPIQVQAEYLELFPLRKYSLQSIRYPESFRETLDLFFSDLLVSCSDLDSSDLWEEIKRKFYQSLRRERLLKPVRKSQNSLRLPESILSLRTADRRAFKRELSRFKVARWKSFIDSISAEDCLRHVWFKFKISRGLPASTLQFGDSSIEVEGIRDQFVTYCTPSIPANPVIMDQLRFCLEIDEPLSTFNEPIRMNELIFALAKCSGNTSPGPDGLPYGIFKQLSFEKKSILLQLLNKFFDDGRIPDNLKQCLQIAMPKSSGDYRPISLMNCFLKIYEHILFERLYAFIDSLLPASQYGFRKKRSSYDQAANLILNIQAGRSANMLVGVIFIDIKKAFDRIDRSELLLDLYHSGVRGKILRALSSIINGFSMRVLYENFVSSSYEPECGTPQGSILSPLLWNFYFRNFNNQLNRSQSFAFADDLALLHLHRDHNSLITQMSSDFDRLNEWCHSKRIEISTEKTKFMDFSKTFRKRKISDPQRISFTNRLSGNVEYLQQVTSYKYLGVILDEQLTWKPWTDHIVSQIISRTTAISRISSTVRLPRHLIEKFYLGYVRGFLNYASCIWNHIPSTQLERIEIADRKGLRLCCGALLRTSDAELYSESSLFSLKTLILRSNLRHGCRLLFTPELQHHLHTINSLKTSSLSMKWLEVWNFFHLPRAPDIRHALLLVYQAAPSQPRSRWKYHQDFWIERLLARVRMGVLPTRSWAFSMRLSDSNLCRHCFLHEETFDHLLTECPVLNRDELFRTWPSHYGSLTLSSIRLVFKEPLHTLRNSLEQSIIRFVRMNDLFKRF
jgi:exonuclease III